MSSGVPGLQHNITMIRYAHIFITRVFTWLIFSTLPITLLPVLTASFSGWTFAFWSENHIYETTDQFLYEIKDSLNDWGVGGGAPSFRKWQDTNDAFQNLRLNSNDWVPKLGLMLPDQYFDVNDETIPIDRFADLDHLVQDMSCRPNQPKSKEQWVWLTSLAFPEYSAWDAAFQYVLRYAQGHPGLNRTSLYHAECTGTASFLCGVWNTRSPALMHFLVEDEPIDSANPEYEGLTYSARPRDLHPVTVRIIEFPLKGAYTGLSPKDFPTEELQLLSIMTRNHLYEQFVPYNEMEQTLTRFAEYMDRRFWYAKDTPFYYINNADEWMAKHVTTPLGVEDSLSLLYSATFSLTVNAVQTFVLMPYQLISGLATTFLGAPGRGDWILGDGSDEDMQGGDLINDLFGSFMEGVPDAAGKLSSKSVLKGVHTSAL
jgi:hypothetical protein